MSLYKVKFNLRGLMFWSDKTDSPEEALRYIESGKEIGLKLVCIERDYCVGSGQHIHNLKDEISLKELKGEIK